MSFQEDIQTKIINARDAAMQVPLQKFRCAWCGNPVTQAMHVIKDDGVSKKGNQIITVQCLDPDWKGCDEETLEPHQRQENWEE